MVRQSGGKGPKSTRLNSRLVSDRTSASVKSSASAKINQGFGRNQKLLRMRDGGFGAQGAAHAHCFVNLHRQPALLSIVIQNKICCKCIRLSTLFGELYLFYLKQIVEILIRFRRRHGGVLTFIYTGFQSVPLSSDN